jgi:glycosyltransferase involved in cell wall biosynthesis
MHILFIHQHFPGQFKFLAPALVDKGYDVSALCINPEKSFSVPSIQVHQYQTDRGSTPNIHPWVMDLETKVIRAEACFKAAMKLKESGYTPDLIIAHIGWGETLFIKEVWPECKLAIYSEFYYHASGADVGFDPEFATPDGVACAMRAKNLNNIAHFDIADAGISPTEWQKSTFPEPFRSKITVVHDGIDTDKLIPNPQASLSLTIGNNPPLVLTKKDQILTFVNRNLEPYRGYHTFMRSLPAILKGRPNLKVLIVGGDKVSYGAAPDPTIYGKLSWKEIFAKEVKPQLTEAQWQQLIFVGHVPYEYFVQLLQISTVHVYLTYPFVLSWSLLEAMSIGCAIVGSDTAPVQEVIKHKETGRLVDFFDARVLAKEVCELLENPTEQKRLGTNARKFVQENYDLRKVCLPAQLEWVSKLSRIKQIK